MKVMLYELEWFSCDTYSSPHALFALATFFQFSGFLIFFLGVSLPLVELPPPVPVTAADVAPWSRLSEIPFLPGS